MRLPARILEHAARLAEGAVLSAKELLHMGTRAAVDQALSRLARAGRLQRVARGLYVLPVETRFGQRPPSVESVVRSLAETRGEAVVPSGAAEANGMGLTTQVPVRTVYLTSGRSRRLELGRRKVELRHARRALLGAGRAGAVLRILDAAGESGAATALREIGPRLTAEERGDVLRARPRMPSWMASRVSAALATHHG